MARKKRTSSRKSGFSMNGAIKVLSGAALAAVYEVFVSPMIPLGDMLKNIIELVAGLILSVMPGMPMPVKAMGAALATINAYSLIVPLVSGWGNNASNQGWS